VFPNFKAVEQDYYRRTGIFPIMHVVAIRKDVHREQPWVAKSIYQAFGRAKALAVDGFYDTDALRVRCRAARPRRGDLARARQGFLALWACAHRPTFEAIGVRARAVALAARGER